MRRISLRQSFLAGMIVLGIASLVPVVAQAIPARAEEAQTNVQKQQEAVQTNAKDRKEAAQGRLVQAKLKACQNREKAITNIMARLSDRGQKQVNLFSTIAERTEKFYVDKGKTLSNYDALVAEVTARKAAAQDAVDGVKSSSTDFSCAGENPKGVATMFKDDLKTEIKALTDYKTSVKNLIVGVKSVQGTTSSADHGGAN